MANTAVKAILFDFGGVLAEEGFRNGLIAIAREQGLDVEAMPTAAMQAVYDSGFVLGRGSAADFWELLRQRTGLIGEDDILTMRILDGFAMRPWMMKLVQQLRKQGFITGILSDQTYWLDELDQRYEFYKKFDHIFNSYYLGKGKQDPSLFTDVAGSLGLASSEILFVDDDAGNVTRARAMGMQAIQYIDKCSFETELAELT